MKIGILGPKSSIDYINKIISRDYPNIRTELLEYKVYTEIIEIINKKENKYDALLFSGTTPYKYASLKLKNKIIWEYIPRRGSSLLATLFEAKQIYDYDIKNISIDSYKKETLFESYEEIGYIKSDLDIYISNDKISESDYMEYLYNFHKNLYLTKKVSCCITGLEKVHNKLSEENIPNVKIKHTSNIIREIVKRLILKDSLVKTKGSQIVVISVKQDNISNYSIQFEDEYITAINRMNIEEEVYFFAKKIQGAVMEMSNNHFLIFSTKKQIENETYNLTKFSLLNNVKENTNSTVSIGIGYGHTALEAKTNALNGTRKAEKAGGNNAYILCGNDKIIGPVYGIRGKNQIDKKIDDELLDLSNNTKIGINTLYKLKNIVKMYNIEDTTSRELAQLYGVTLRSMNRILSRLEDHGYVEIVGKKKLSKKGRPSRIIRLKLSRS